MKKQLLMAGCLAAAGGEERLRPHDRVLYHPNGTRFIVR